MGPRPISRGERRKDSRRKGSHRLQWGRGRSAAESAPPIRQAKTTLTLQWGRGRSAAESHSRWGTAAQIRASMGPRPISRGEAIGGHAR